VASQLLVAMDAGIKRVAALEFHSHNIAVRVVVHTLSVLIDAGTAHYHRICDYAVFFRLIQRINQQKPQLFKIEKPRASSRAWPVSYPPDRVVDFQRFLSPRILLRTRSATPDISQKI
jgi:hypothetical protein